jgi:SOS-response transcriptional repressor LexA
MTAAPVTPRQAQVLAFVRRHWREHGQAPTVQQVADFVSPECALRGEHASPNAAWFHLTALTRKGFLEPGRGLYLTGLRDAIKALPLLAVAGLRGDVA